MKRIISAVLVTVAITTSAFAADLSVESQFDITGKNDAKNYLTVKGPGESVTKATIADNAVDAKSGATTTSKGTEVLNSYRAGADKKSTLPGSLQSLLKYGASPEKFFIGDALNAKKAANGIITIQYCHRGTAYIMVSDAKGQFTLPEATCKMRKIANLEKDGTQLVSKEFSPTGKVADINWAKVWDETIADGTVITKVKAADGKETEVKTGKVTIDAAPSATPYTGVLSVTLVGNVMNLKGDLNLKK